MKHYKHIRTEARAKTKESLDLCAFEALRALARFKTGKGVKKGRMPIEPYKALPMVAKMEFIHTFREYKNRPETVPPTTWRIAEFMVVPK